MSYIWRFQSPDTGNNKLQFYEMFYLTQGNNPQELIGWLLQTNVTLIELHLGAKMARKA